MGGDLLGLEVEVKSFRESVQLDLARGEEPLGRLTGGSTRWGGEGGGEHPLGEVARKVAGHQEPLLLVGAVEGVDEGRVGDGVVVVLILVLLRLSSNFVQVLGGLLASRGDVIAFQDPGNEG